MKAKSYNVVNLDDVYEEPYYIYVLIDPRNGEVRYVGRTQVPKHRLHGHILDGRKTRGSRGPIKKVKWLRSIIADNKLPVMEIVAVCCFLKEANYAEKFFMYYLIKKGVSLTNRHLPDMDDEVMGNIVGKSETLAEAYSNAMSLFHENQQKKISQIMKKIKEKNNALQEGMYIGVDKCSQGDYNTDHA